MLFEKRKHPSPNTEFKKGNIPWNKGINNWKDIPHPRGMLGKHHSEKSKQIMREKHLGRIVTEKMMENFHKPKSESHKRNIGLAHLGKKRPPFSEEWIRKLIISSRKAQIKPNKEESFLFNKVQSLYPDEYKHNLPPNITVINGRIPDLINCNGQKKAINFNGIYWHLLRLQKDNPTLTKEQIEEKERKPYEELGFKLLIIWEDELRNENVLTNKIKGFIDG